MISGKFVIIENWDLPKSCTECPLFKVQVANAGNQAKLFCKVTNEILTNADLLSEARSINCPMKEFSIIE